MPQKAVNKVIYNGNVLIDLTSDTITPAQLASGITAHDKTGAAIVGTSDFDSNTTDADALASEILLNKTAYVNKVKLTGTMPNRGSVTGTISTLSGFYSIPQGYHDGSGSVSISSTEQDKLIAENIRQGITILGVQGSMSGTEDVNAQTVTLIPSASSQTRTPGTGYNYISQVTVEAIPYTETDNAAGGKTITIAGAA